MRLVDDYLDDVRTKETLVGAVQGRVIQTYDEFFDSYVAAEKSRGNNVVVAKKGDRREDAIWDVDTFAEWSDGVFRVGIRSYDDDDDEVDRDV